jgi:hypothetical protein
MRTGKWHSRRSRECQSPEFLLHRRPGKIYGLRLQRTPSQGITPWVNQNIVDATNFLGLALVLAYARRANRPLEKANLAHN